MSEVAKRVDTSACTLACRSPISFAAMLSVYGLSGAQMRGCGGVTPPIISTPGPSCNLMGISRSRSGPVRIEFLFITPLAASSSVGAVIYLL